jgi:lipopolysaccharide transport system permease protein
MREASDWLVRITPKGVTRRPRTLTERTRLVASELTKIVFIIRSELRSRVFDKSLGMLFLALDPIIMAVLYYVLSQVMFGARSDARDFASIYCIVVFWRWFSKTVDGSPSVFVSYSAILRQSNFSVISVLISYLGIELANFLIGCVVLAIFLAILGIRPSWSWLLMPIPLLAELSFLVAITTLCSTAGTFFRDLQGILYAFTSIWFYLSPGIYPIALVPEKYLWIYMLNPFAHILPAYHDILLAGRVPDLLPLLAITASSTLTSVLAFRVLNSARYHFLAYL